MYEGTYEDYRKGRPELCEMTAEEVLRHMLVVVTPFDRRLCSLELVYRYPVLRRLH
jgi:hypothetical protein